LLAAVDLQEDFSLRQRAVNALGELGDPRALDLLLKIVNDPVHELRPQATEAIGRMSRSAKASEILSLLSGLARSSDHLAEFALRGLRWFDHPEGWQLIRRQAADDHIPFRETAVELLGYNDDPATRDLLLRLLADRDLAWLLDTTLKSARRLWGQDSLEPDYAAIRNEDIGEETDELFRRLQERGDARRMLEILPHLDEEAAERLEKILLSRQPVPVAEALAVLAGPDAAACGVAAHLLGRANAKETGSAILAALGRWWSEWDKGRQEETRRGAEPGKMVGSLLTPLCNLIWAVSRAGGGEDLLVTMSTTRAGVPFDRPLRRAAVAALAARPNPASLPSLEQLLQGGDPEIRASAAQAIALANPAQIAQAAGQVLSDRVAFNRLTKYAKADLSEVLRPAAAQVHYQGVAVPYLAAHGDIAALAAVADNGSLSEECRCGAVEGLTKVATTASEAELVRIGQTASNPEELRKAAWRGLRRSRRARERAKITEAT
jgi:ParB family chromosome partitioning protein